MNFHANVQGPTHDYNEKGYGCDSSCNQKKKKGPKDLPKKHQAFRDHSWSQQNDKGGLRYFDSHTTVYKQ